MMKKLTKKATDGHLIQMKILTVILKIKKKWKLIKKLIVFYITSEQDNQLREQDNQLLYTIAEYCSAITNNTLKGSHTL